jgi:hypothetical protein
MKRTAESTARSASARCTNRRISIVTPIHTFGGQGSNGASSIKRSWRLVRIWNVCCSAMTITSKISRGYSNGISSWKRSLIELTKIIRGRRQRSGCSTRAGQRRRSKPRS